MQAACYRVCVRARAWGWREMGKGEGDGTGDRGVGGAWGVGQGESMQPVRHLMGSSDGGSPAGRGRVNGNRCTPASSNLRVPVTTNLAP
jgi:hypothetical protein